MNRPSCWLPNAATSVFCAAVALALVAGCGGSDDETPANNGAAGSDAGSDTGSGGDGSVPNDGSPSDGATNDGATPNDGSTPDDGSTPIDAGNYVPYQPPCGNTPSTKVIGNWDVVPGQVFDGSFGVGVVAFHEYGVDVVFTVNGAPVATVENPSYNARTGVWEYWVELDAADYADGSITVGATIEPDCPDHLSRQLEDLQLYANAGGSLSTGSEKWVDCTNGSDQSGDGSESSPYATIEKGVVEVATGGTVRLAAGSCYTMTKLYASANHDRWTTVEPAPGVTRDQVQIVGSGPNSDGRFGENNIRWKDVQIYKDVAPGHSTIMYLESGHRVWFDGAELYDANGQWNGGSVIGGNNPYRVYSTDGVLRDVENVTGVCGFCRGLDVRNIGSDIFRAASNIMAINTTIKGIDIGTTSAHPDLFQLYAPGGNVENIVIYNTKVTDMGAQGIFGGEGTLRDVAFVNLLMEKDPASSALMSQISGDWGHVLLWHVTTVDSTFWLRDTSQIANFWVQDNAWQMFHASAATDLSGSTIDHNLFRVLNWNQPAPMGTNAIEGDPLFADEATDDYHLTNGSPAQGAGVPLPGVPVDLEGKLYDSTAPNLGAFAD